MQCLVNQAKSGLLIGKRFSVSQLDVDELKNWEHVLNAHEKVVTEMPSDVLEHFFSGLFLWKFDVLHSKFTLKVTFLSRMSFVFSDISYLCWKFRPSFVGPFETSGALILGLTQFWSTVLSIRLVLDLAVLHFMWHDSQEWEFP